MKNRIASIALTVVMILGCMIKGIDFNVNTVCADPYNIEISVETKEISIEEIPENRRIQVEVYASNVPNEDFYIFDVTFKLGDKLENWIDRCLGMHAISSLSVSARTENNCLFIESNTVIHSNKKIENGRIFDISVFIPPEVNEGDFYEITPISDCNNGYDFTSFVFESNKDVLYDASNFSFCSGGIKIRSSQPEQPVQSESVSSENDVISNQQNEDSIIQTPVASDNSYIKEETNTSISTETITSAVSLTTTTTTNVISNTTTILTPFESSIENVTNITTTKNNNTKEHNKNNYAILFIILIVILIITITVIIRKRKKK